MNEQLSFPVPERYPRSAKYDPRWVLENQMGPNVLWLTEAMAQVMDLQPGMRVLDMGCGKAISSIFLAREYGVQVWATDLWISASENWERICAAGMQAQVYPIQAEAHALPYARGFFDAAVSMDAYHYFGSDELYLGYYFANLLRPGAQFGIVVPGLFQEFTDGIPEHLLPYWEWEFYTFHSPAWWHKHWEKVSGIKVEVADWLSEGWKEWMEWIALCEGNWHGDGAGEAEMLHVDGGKNLGFTRVVARKK